MANSRRPPSDPALTNAVLYLETPRLYVVTPPVSYASHVAAYYKRNVEHLRPWEPARPASHTTEAYWRQQLAAAERAFAAGQALRMFLLPRSLEQVREVIGACSLTELARGPRMDGLLGYSLDREWQGQGLMAEALQALVTYAFDVLKLNRVSANYMPSNERSARLLSGLGFQIEGLARRLVAIAGAWQDHVLTSKLNPRPPASETRAPL